MRAEAEYMFEYNRMSRPCSWFAIYFFLAVITCIAMFYAVLPYTFLEYNDALLTNINSDMITVEKCGTAMKTKLVEEMENLDDINRSPILENDGIKVCPRTKYTVDNMVIYALGQAVGSSIGGLLGDLYGRRKVCIFMFGLWVPAIVAATIPSTAVTYQCIYFVMNVAGGGILVLTYVNIMEISNKKHRFYIMFMPCTLYIALTITAFDFQAKFLRYTTCQYMNVVNLFLMAFAIWYIPESPRWLMNKGRREEAFQMLIDFRIDTECQLISAGEELPATTTWQIVKGMCHHLKRRKMKVFIVFCILSIVNAFLYSLPTEAEYMFEYNRMSKSCSWFAIYFFLAVITNIAMYYAVLPYTFLEYNDAILTSINSDMISLKECGTAMTKKLVEEVENIDGIVTSPILENEASKMCPRTKYTVDNMAIGGGGQAVGSFIGGLLGDLYGRRKVCLFMFGLWVPAIVAATIPGTAVTYQCIYFVMNVAGGGIWMLVYVNIMEISHKKHRFYIMFMPCTLYIGLTITAFDFKAKFLRYTTCQYLNVVNLFLMAFAMWYIPESPRWLMNKGRREEAFQMLKDFSIDTECQLISTGEELPASTTWQIVKGMCQHLKRRKMKVFIIFCILSIVNAFLYTLPRWQGIYIEYEKWTSFRFVRMTAWILSVPFTVPVYFAFGLKFGQLFLYVSYGLSSLIMTFVTGGTIILIVYNTFATVFSLSGNVLLYWCVVETVPTFMRATAVAICYALFSLVEAILVSTQGLWPYKMTRFIMMIIMCAMSVLGMLVVFLPRSSPKKDLPNHKLIVI